MTSIKGSVHRKRPTAMGQNQGGEKEAVAGLSLTRGATLGWLRADRHHKLWMLGVVDEPGLMGVSDRGQGFFPIWQRPNDGHFAHVPCDRWSSIKTNVSG